MVTILNLIFVSPSNRNRQITNICPKSENCDSLYRLTLARKKSAGKSPSSPMIFVLSFLLAKIKHKEARDIATFLHSKTLSLN